MNRFLPALLFLLLSLLGLLGVAWYLGYGSPSSYPPTAFLEGMETPARFTWTDEHQVLIEASNETDALRALGYAHGVARTWEIVHLRQVALGRLGEWFGERALPIDALVRQLGLARHAQSSFEALPAEDQAFLTAYGEGVQAALARKEVSRVKSFAATGIAPARWEPWHALALERLYAWLAAPPLSPDLFPADSAAIRFATSDRRLREWVRLHGLEYSAAWTRATDAGTMLYQRHVFGATAVPLLLESTLQVGATRWVTGGALPGTPFFPAGKSAAHTWSVLMHSPRTTARLPADSTLGPVVYERMLSPDGSESLVAYRRSGDRTSFGLADATTADSTASLVWTGLVPGSDTGSWRQVLSGTPGAFGLISGTGLSLRTDGTTEVWGTPISRANYQAGTIIGNTDWVPYLSARLDTLARLDPAASVVDWADDTYSLFAAQLTPALVAAAEQSTGQSTGEPAAADTLTQEALTYLRNWDYKYNRLSIAGTIFDSWMATYRDRTGSFPLTLSPDSAALPTAVRQRSGALLKEAVARLAEVHGRDMRQWQWGLTYPDRRYFPPWPLPNAPGDSTEASKSRPFAPLNLPSQGHPSTLRWGTAPVAPLLASPDVWESWAGADPTAPFIVRRRDLSADAFLARYLISEAQPVARPLP